ncbi:MAG TPA: HAMP domain-containing sensor histidine kinase [Candidatus Sulfotelmatobacter sp.]|nr:HAMP domain-containing sensor histidine kinase [Candidatus Sulfotelmatobacter sp.]
MLRILSPTQSLVASDLDSFRRQESILIALNLLILVVLFLLHLYFASFWGKPAPLLIVAVCAGILLKSGEWLWLRRLTRVLKPKQLATLTWVSIALNVTLATVLGILTDKEDTPYFALMVVAVLEAAFRFELAAITAVVTVVDISLFWQVRWFFDNHPPLDVGEYYEAGISSLLFFIVGVLVWLLLADLRGKETRLATNLLELEQAREQLVREERLAAVGRLSSAIAHEIRNPVAMIASSIATAKQLRGEERDEMFAIAADEANRLSTLTTDFLDYASTRPLNLSEMAVRDVVGYVADASRAHASKKGVHFELEVPVQLTVCTDGSQLQQALLNLLLNAVDASLPEATILIRARDQGQNIHIDVENEGASILEPAISRIFEPFFTTKPRGTGLGLAIARNIARTQGGDLVLAVNEPGRVCFSLIMPRHCQTPKRRGN